MTNKNSADLFPDLFIRTVRQVKNGGAKVSVPQALAGKQVIIIPLDKLKKLTETTIKAKVRQIRQAAKD